MVTELACIKLQGGSACIVRPYERSLVMSATRLMDFLDRNAVHYVTMRHSPAYTAQGIAAALIAGWFRRAIATALMMKGMLVSLIPFLA